MKKLFFVTLVLLGTVYGCQKADFQPGNDIRFGKETYELQLISLDDPYLLLDVINVDADQLDKDISVELRGDVHKANGHFLSAGQHNVVFSAIDNHGGVHGKADMSGPVYNMHLKTMCISVVDNRATIAGIITEIEDLPDNYPTTLDVGYQFYYAVEDNGEGNNTAPERSHGYVYIGPPEAPPLCEFLLPYGPYWPEAYWFDTIGENDQIDVK